jgi:RNA polymerase sigma factor (sigma-70 family)
VDVCGGAQRGDGSAAIQYPAAAREQVVARDRSEWFDAKLDGGLEAEAAQAALELLPRELREIVVLRIWGELGYAQIAQVSGVSLGTAHQRFAEAMKQLRAALEAKRQV